MKRRIRKSFIVVMLVSALMWLGLITIFLKIAQAEVCLVSNNREANIEIQNCIDSSINGGTVELALGKYIVTDRISVNKAVTITTLNKPASDKTCGVRSKDCTLLIKDNNFTAIDGIFSLDAKGASIRHLRLNGNRSGRKRARKQANICKRQVHGHRNGINISVNASYTKIEKVASFNNACGANIEVRDNAKFVTITDNKVINSGRHDAEFSDGITVHYTENSNISNNLIKNSTDVGLIFGGALNTTVRGNIISHTTHAKRGSFAGILIYNWRADGSFGDYTGTVFSNNVVRCSKKYRCGLGIGILTSMWSSQTRNLSNITLENNSVVNAQIGVHVGRNARNVSIKGMSIKKQWAKGTEFPATCYKRKGSIYTTSPDAVESLNAERTKEGRGIVVTDRYDVACIPNPYRKEF